MSMTIFATLLLTLTTIVFAKHYACSQLNISQCLLSTNCEVFYGWTASEVCDGNYLTQVPSGCKTKQDMCAQIITWARASVRTTPMVFPTACIPSEWITVDEDLACKAFKESEIDASWCNAQRVRNLNGAIGACDMGACLQACGSHCSSTARCTMEIRPNSRYYTCINGEVWKGRASAKDVCP